MDICINLVQSCKIILFLHYCNTEKKNVWKKKDLLCGWMHIKSWNSDQNQTNHFWLLEGHLICNNLEMCKQLNIDRKTGWNHHHHHHHHHVVPLARISLTLSRHFSLLFIASGRSSGLHPVSSHSCWMHVRAGCPTFARPYVGVHRSTSLMSSSLLLQQCPACLVCLTWIVFMMGGRWPYSWCLVGCCRQGLFNIARSILV